MKAQDLKNSILQLAIQGKLVPQDPNDEHASELLKKIKAEKAELVKQGKIKKDKQESHIYKGDDNKYYEQIGSEIKDITDEIPFEIPNNWEWVKCGNLFSTQSGLSFNKDVLSEQKDGSVRILRGGNILNDKYHFLANDIFIPRKYITKDIYLKKNWIITPAVTSIEQIGKMALIDRDIDDCVVGGFVLNIIPHLSNDILAKYILFAMMSNYFIQSLKGITNKSGQAFYNLSREKMLNLYIPLPPLSEQKRIVKKIEELEPLVKQYDKAETELSALNGSFPEQLKKSSLQYAIQGKLVPQDTNDEPAEVLYAKIQAEKQKLIKEGKIKKDKPLPRITDDEIPFTIPSTWKWVRLGDIFAHNTGKALNSSKQEGKFKKYITTSNVYWNYFQLNEVREMRFNDDEIQKCTVTKGDLLVCEGGDIGRAAIWNYDYDICIQNHIHRLRAYSEVCTMFFYYIFFLYKMAGYIGGKGIGIQGLSSGALHNIWVPLPPLAEQKRIVAKVNELMKYCEELTHPEKRKEVEPITIEWLIDKGFDSCKQNGYTDVNAILDELNIAVMQDRNLKKGRIEYDNNKKKFQIWVNDLNDNWTKAHELVHYVNDNNEIKLYGEVGRKDETSLSKSKERNVDVLTAEILMPEDIFVSAVEQDNIGKYAFVDNATIRKLGKQFRVSDDAVKIRLQNLGYHTK